MNQRPRVSIVYNDKFPPNFINDVNGWSFSEEDLKNNFGKLLTLDIDFGNLCTLNCPHCFRKNNRVDFDGGKSRMMSYDHILNVVKEGKRLGLKSVKFLGAGEPFQDKRFLEFLRELKRLDIIPLIFTKGHVIGDNEEVKKWCAHYGINTGEELVAELNRLNASILLGFNSFNEAVQEKMVGGIKGYVAKRNRAIELLVKAGFNGHNPTRLCLAANPVTNDNYGEIMKIYKWGRMRNIYVIVCPTMVSGRCSKEFAWQKINPSANKLIDLYVSINEFNLKNGLITIGQLEKDGIASYAGGHPCNQVACGMYVTLTGKVLRCPGDDTTILGDIWNESLGDIWRKSENYKRAGTFNCGCPPKLGKTIPSNLFKEVMVKLKKVQQHG